MFTNICTHTHFLSIIPQKSLGEKTCPLYICLRFIFFLYGYQYQQSRIAVRRFKVVCFTWIISNTKCLKTLQKLSLAQRNKTQTPWPGLLKLVLVASSPLSWPQHTWCSSHTALLSALSSTRFSPCQNFYIYCTIPAAGDVLLSTQAFQIAL